MVWVCDNLQPGRIQSGESRSPERERERGNISTHIYLHGGMVCGIDLQTNPIRKVEEITKTTTTTTGIVHQIKDHEMEIVK